jgi:hypothetical protein
MKRIFLGILLTLSVVFAWAGTSTHGGDEIGLEFQSAYLFALEDIKLNHRDLYEQIESSDVYQLSTTTRVLVVDRPLVINVDFTTQESVATNDSKLGLILVNRSRWTAIRSEAKKTSLALHEILSIAGIENSGLYTVSAVYFSKINSNKH